jgi:hypothetical protein
MSSTTDYTHSFQIPSSKDWVFRQSTKRDGTPGSQAELKDNHPDVTRIHVADRGSAKPTTAGFDVVKLTIRGKDQQSVMDCYQEGRTKILASLAYDAEKADKAKQRKVNNADRRHFQKVRELEAKNAPKPVSKKPSGSMMVQKAMSAIKAHEAVHGDGQAAAVAMAAAAAAVAREMDTLAEARNGFAGLEIEEVKTDEAIAQAEANLRKQRRLIPAVVEKPVKSALSGWATMASKAPVVATVAKHSSVVAGAAPKKKAVLDWDAPDGGGWDAVW